MEPTLHYFEGDAVTPNNSLPVLVYQQIIPPNVQDAADYLEQLFISNNWSNNWRDIVLAWNHYHSSTHEVLGISKGSIKLHLGGKHGKVIEAQQGDVLILPAGVGHYSLEPDKDYEVIGGYPEGRRWDMIYDEPEKYQAAVKAIASLPLPGTDPILGAEGPLTRLWK